MASPAEGQERYTYSDYLTWDDGVRRELIDGKIFVMGSPPPSRSHQELLDAVYLQILEQLEDSGLWRVVKAPFTVQLSDELEHDPVAGPDLSVVGACPSDRSPQWIVEIVSSASAAKDQILKPNLCERHCVPEFWIVHPHDCMAWIYTLDGSGGYGAAEIIECIGSSTVGAIPEINIDWDRAFRRVPKEV